MTFYNHEIFGTIPDWGLLGIGVFSLWTWKSSQKSSRRAAAMEFLDNFTNTPGARNASLMLSARTRDVPLWDKSEPSDRYVKVSWDDITKAFSYDEKIEEYPTDSKSTAIRDSFDDFFGKLARINILIRDEAINKEDVDDIMRHWIWVFSPPRSNLQHIKLVFEYIKRCNLKNTIKLFELYKIEIE
jgi:hypothetical protein